MDGLARLIGASVTDRLLPGLQSILDPFLKCIVDQRVNVSAVGEVKVDLPDPLPVEIKKTVMVPVDIVSSVTLDVSPPYLMQIESAETAAATAAAELTLVEIAAACSAAAVSTAATAVSTAASALSLVDIAVATDATAVSTAASAVSLVADAASNLSSSLDLTEIKNRMHDTFKVHVENTRLDPVPVSSGAPVPGEFMQVLVVNDSSQAVPVTSGPLGTVSVKFDSPQHIVVDNTVTAHVLEPLAVSINNLLPIPVSIDGNNLVTINNSPSNPARVIVDNPSSNPVEVHVHDSTPVRVTNQFSGWNTDTDTLFQGSSGAPLVAVAASTGADAALGFNSGGHRFHLAQAGVHASGVAALAVNSFSIV